MLIAAIAAVHLAMNACNISRVFFGHVLRVIEVYYRQPPENRIFVRTAEEQTAIMQIRRLTPPDARILWLLPVWRMANYYIYHRTSFQQREYKPGEIAIIDPAFISSRKITHIHVDPEKIIPVASAGAARQDLLTCSNTGISGRRESGRHCLPVSSCRWSSLSRGLSCTGR